MSGNDINLHIGNKLRERRIMLGLSQGAVGDALGIASQQVQKYEKGTNAMNAERLHQVAQLFKIPVAYFFEDFSSGKKAGKRKFSFAEDAAVYGQPEDAASDRESIELLKSFKRISDPALRKRIADLLRTISIKDM